MSSSIASMSDTKADKSTWYVRADIFLSVNGAALEICWHLVASTMPSLPASKQADGHLLRSVVNIALHFVAMDRNDVVIGPEVKT